MKHMHFVFLILALIAILLFLRPKEKFQPAFNRLTAPGEINLRKLVATTIDLPMGVIDIVRGYDFPGQVVNVVQYQMNDTIAQLEQLFKQYAKSSVAASNKDDIISADDAYDLRFSVRNWLIRYVEQWLNPNDSFLDSIDVQQEMKDLIWRVTNNKNMGEYPLIKAYTLQATKENNAIRYAKILRNLEVAKSFMKRETESNPPRTLAQLAMPSRFGNLPEIADTLIREISDLDPDEDNREVERRLVSLLPSEEEEVEEEEDEDFGDEDDFEDDEDDFEEDEEHI
jgi:hypothetical protein